jgi:hypothetical protein
MALVVPHASTPRKVLIVAACVLAGALFQTPVALAQRVSHAMGAGHFRNGVRVAVPHVVAAPTPRAMFLSPRGGLPGRGPLILRRPFFTRAPFLWSWEALNSSWWLYCAPIWGLNSGCGDLFLRENSVDHYLAPPLAYNSSVYVHSLDAQAMVQLFLKDGTVYSVNDYWFVNNEVHFTILDESGTKSVEQVIGSEELDLQRTIDVNTRRGFRVVVRNEPIEEYLRDHPDLTPQLVQPPQ